MSISQYAYTTGEMECTFDPEVLVEIQKEWFKSFAAKADVIQFKRMMLGDWTIDEHDADICIDPTQTIQEKSSCSQKIKLTGSSKLMDILKAPTPQKN